MRTRYVGVAVAAAVVAVLVLPTVAAGHGEAHQVREERHDVWTKWLSVYPTRDAEEPVTYRVEDGKSLATGVGWRRDTSMPVRNVTMVARIHGVDVRGSFGETMAGDPLQGDYAYWPGVDEDTGSPEDGGFVILSLETPTDTSDPFTVDFVLLFEGPDGTQYYNVTSYDGVVEDRNDVAVVAQEHLPPWAGQALVASIPFLLGLGALAWRARRAEPGA